MTIKNKILELDKIYNIDKFIVDNVDLFVSATKHYYKSYNGNYVGVITTTNEENIKDACNIALLIIKCRIRKKNYKHYVNKVYRVIEDFDLIYN